MCLIKNNFDFINLKFLCKLTTKEEEEKVCGRCGDHFDDCWVHSAPCYTHTGAHSLAQPVPQTQPTPPPTAPHAHIHACPD